MAEGKEFIGLWIPKEILQHPILTSSEKLILAEITALAKGKACTASNQHIAETVGTGIENVRKVIYKLIKLNLLKSHVYRDAKTKQVIKRELVPMVSQCHTLCDYSTIPSGTTIPYPMTVQYHTLCDEDTTPSGIGIPIENIDKSIDKNIEKNITKTTTPDRFGEVMSLFQNNIHPVANQVEADDLADMYDEFGAEWCVQAIKEAARNRARTVNYISKILCNWKVRGIEDPWDHPEPKEQRQADTKQSTGIPQFDMAQRVIAMLEAEDAEQQKEGDNNDTE